MGSIRKRGATYRAEVYRKGIRDSATFYTRQEAVDWITRREVDLLDGAVPLGRQTVAQALAKTAKTLSKGTTFVASTRCTTHWRRFCQNTG